VNKPSDFHLSKWYLDCVGDDGDTLIIYSADLNWKVLNLHYSSILHYNRNTGAHTRTSLEKSPSPELRDSSLRWASRALNFKGIWNSLAQPIQQNLYEAGDGGRIRWSCVQPSADVEIQIGEQRIKGSGYAERMDMTVVPWKLPIRELRWGRFHSPGHAIVWIDWKGSLPQTFLFHNGEPVTDGSVTDHEVLFDDRRTVLTLEKKQVLRDGPIVSTALSMIPGIGMLLPKKFLSANETKWQSDGSLEEAGAPPLSGKAIHELVMFS
jgi:hypothetical protein